MKSNLKGGGLGSLDAVSLLHYSLIVLPAFTFWFGYFTFFPAGKGLSRM